MRFIFPIITLTSSFCSMAYSMILSSNMTELTGEEVISQCLTMGPYLLGLGFGSAMGDRVRVETRLQKLWTLEWLSALILPVMPLIQILFVFCILNFTSTSLNLESKSALWSLLSMTGVLAFVAGILGGAQLPLILKHEKALPQEWTLSINYLGPLFAGIAIVQMNQAATNLGFQIYLIGLVQILGLFMLVWQFEKRLKSMFLLFIPLLLLTGGAWLYPKVEVLTMKSSYMGTKLTVSDLKNPTNL